MVMMCHHQHPWYRALAWTLPCSLLVTADGTTSVNMALVHPIHIQEESKKKKKRKKPKINASQDHSKNNPNPLQDIVSLLLCYKVIFRVLTGTKSTNVF